MMVRLLSILAALCFATAAEAQDVWAIPGSACVPSANSIFDQQYTTTYTSVGFATGKVGTINLFCAIPRFNSGTTSWNLRITYQDSNGAVTTAYVRARVIRMALGAASGHTVATIISNSSPSTGINTLGSPTFEHTFDFEVNNYWLWVEIVRASAADIETFYAAYLDGTSL